MLLCWILLLFFLLWSYCVGFCSGKMNIVVIIIIIIVIIIIIIIVIYIYIYITILKID
jgi:hypothetical protein